MTVLYFLTLCYFMICYVFHNVMSGRSGRSRGFGGGGLNEELQNSQILRVGGFESFRTGVCEIVGLWEIRVTTVF